MISGGSIGGRGDGGDCPPPLSSRKRARKIFLNVGENKSSEKTLIPFVSAARYVE